MAGKTQQYELLSRSADRQLAQSDDVNPFNQDQRKIRQWTGHALLHNGFPAQVAEATSPSKATFFWIIISHIVVTGILIATIVLGATKRTYAINEQAQFLGMTLSVDNQMFFFGLFNKVADYVLNDSIGRISGVLLTVWMSGKTRFPGVLPLDFELSAEMAKPWRSILNNVQRWKLDPPENKSVSILRILATFASGWTVLLLGGSFNVVAMPKLRWTGVSGGTAETDIGDYFEVPTTRIDNINWSHLDNSYGEVFANEVDRPRLPLGGFIAAMSSLDLLADLVHAINIGSTKYTEINRNNGPAFVNLYTIQRARPVQYEVNFREPPLAIRGRGQTNANLTAEATLSTTSIQEGPIYDFWTDGNHTIYATNALGARNWFNLTLPLLSTMCISATNDTIQDTSVIGPSDSSSSFAINIPGNDATSGMSCNISVQQKVFPIYIYNSTQDARDELNTPLAHPEYYMKHLSFDKENAAIASSLAAKINATIPYLEQATGSSFATMTTSLSKRVTDGANTTFIGTSANVAMNYVIGSLAQHLITIAAWEESDSDQRHRIGPIQFQLYGSGPRQDWQWAIAAVLGLAVLVLGYDMFLLAYRRITPGPWLSVPGMMIAANSAPSLKTHKDEDDRGAKIGELSEEIERTRYCMAAGSDGTVGISRLDVRQRKRYSIEQ